MLLCLVESRSQFQRHLSPLKNYQSYGPLPVEGVWEKKFFFFAGTVTNSEYSVHLEGALQSAEKAVREII